MSILVLPFYISFQLISEIFSHNL